MNYWVRNGKQRMSGCGKKNILIPLRKDLSIYLKKNYKSDIKIYTKNIAKKFNR